MPIEIDTIETETETKTSFFAETCPCKIPLGFAPANSSEVIVL